MVPGSRASRSAISGLLRTASGSIKVDGQEISNKRPDQVRGAGVAVVPEGRRLLPNLTVAENLQVSQFGVPNGTADAAIKSVLELFPELEKRWGQPAKALSGGEQQMVVLAMALVANPKILVIDELSLGLAPIVVQRLVPTVRDVAAKQGIGVLLIEQFAHVVLGLANTAYVMEGSKIRYHGTAQELKANPDLLHSAYLLRK